MAIESLLLIMVVVWGTGVIFRRLNLPILLGELLAGVIFGPALLGVFHDSETIQLLAELGIFFLMFHAGLETSPKDLINASKTSLGIALGGMVLPLTLGFVVSRAFGYGIPDSVFIGLGLSITAIAVTTKLFRDFKFNQSKIAHEVMGAAIVDHILAFVILSILLVVVEGGGTISGAELGIVIGKVALFFGGVIIAGNKLLPYFEKVFKETGHKAFTFTLVVALAFGVFAEWIGLHSILGAYLAGLFVKEEVVHPEVYRKIEDRFFALSYSFLGPIFFVSLGFHVDFAVFSDPSTLSFLVAIIIAAIIGKVVGSGGMRYYFKRDLNEAAVVGFSMNGRGAVELVIAVIGLEMGLIDSRAFSVLVFMAFVTTLITPISLKLGLKAMGKKEFSK